MIARPRERRIRAITDSPSHLLPYLGSLVAKLPGDGAPPVEPPPALKARIMDVVHAEVRASGGHDGPLTLPASASSAAAPAAGARVTISGSSASLCAWGLPAAPAGAAYRVWLLHGAAPQPGPRLDLDAKGCATLDLTALGAAEELVVALEGADGVPLMDPVLRVLLPPGVAASAGR